MTTQSEKMLVCEWTAQAGSDWSLWDTGCGNTFHLEDGTPGSNGMRFCCFCGGKLGGDMALSQRATAEEIEAQEISESELSAATDRLVSRMREIRRG